jgi:diacylglycerol kinase family enzyme
MPIDVVVNRNARRLAAGSLAETIARACLRGGARLHETRDLAALEGVAKAIAARGTQGVVLAGGDGSYMAGVSALARAFGGALPPVGLAPGGTVGTVARAFGLGSDPHAWAEGLVRAACAGSVRIERKGTLLVTAGGSSPAMPEQRVGFIFGAGLVARFFEEYYAAPSPGLASAAQIAARVFAGSFVGTPLARRVLAKAPATLEVDGGTSAALPRRGRDGGWSLILASVVRDVGLHVLATYRAGESLERFHVVASGSSPVALGLQAPRVLLGLPMQPLWGEAQVDALAADLRVRFDEPAGFVLDGELLRAKEVRVSAGPVLPLMVPAGSR